MLRGKKITLGIIDNIVAYKACYIIRGLIKQGVEVQAVTTPAGEKFITPITLSILTSKPIISEFFTQRDGTWDSRVDLGLWAGAILIALATASTISKMANGIADNTLITTYLSAKAPVLVTLAMDLDIFTHPATQKNLDILRSYGNHIIEPGTGELASHLVRKGRMEEPENITRVLDKFFVSSDELSGKKVMITAGSTYEKTDPVHFTGNYSSREMGFTLAEKCACRGAQVILITGPMQLKTKHSRTRRVGTESAREMYAASRVYFPDVDAGILYVAVTDYRPEMMADKRIKREEEEELALYLQAAQDITTNLETLEGENQLLVGFALETNNGRQSAEGKLKRKDFDFIMLNSLNDAEAGSRHDTNKISITGKKGRTDHPLKPEAEVVQDTIDRLVATLSPGF